MISTLVLIYRFELFQFDTNAFLYLLTVWYRYIKWFLDSCGHKGLNDMISFTDDKSGYAQTVVGFCAGPGEDVTVFDGRTMGTIVPPRGSLDFGWDPVFQPKEGGGLTYAEMSKEAKDAISHRSRAFEKLRSYLESEADSIKAKIGSVAN